MPHFFLSNPPLPYSQEQLKERLLQANAGKEFAAEMLSKVNYKLADTLSRK